MSPTERGRFCGRCAEDVVDLARLTRREAERAVRSGRARCAQLAVDQDGRPVFAPEPPGKLAKLALRAALAGALASGCSAEEPPAVPAPSALEAPRDAAADRAPLEIGSGSLLTGHGDEIPPAAHRPPPPVIAPPVWTAPPTRPALPPPPTLPALPPPAIPGNQNAPPPSAPQTQIDPPEHELSPPVHHLRGRIAFHR